MTGEQLAGARGDDQRHWRAVRRALKENRHRLAAAAATLYADLPRVEGTGLICRDQWVPPHPVELGQVQLRWAGQPPAPAITGASPASAHVRPVTAAGEPYPTYADAIAALDPPALFENRPAYRILSAGLSPADGAGHLDLTSGHYFDAVSCSGC